MSACVIGVSGLNAADNPGPGVGVARSLKEDAGLEARIVGLAYDAMEPGVYLDWLVDRSFLMPYPSGGGDAVVERLRYIQSRCGLDVVIPNLDAELPVYIDAADRLAAEGIRTFLPDMAQFRLRGKDRLPLVAAKIGLALPETRSVSTPEALAQAVKDIGLPVMVKGCYYRAYRCHSVPEALAHYHEVIAEWGAPAIVQEVLKGEELNMVGLGDGEGGSLGTVGIKKLTVTALGKIWTGVTVRNAAMQAAAAAFMREFRWRGPFELECMIAQDRLYLIEINPRFPAWSYFATGVGLNLPARLVRRLLGEPLPPAPDYEAGRLFVRYAYERVADLATFQQLVTRGEVP
jgi:carbamoyl-phosphate synthase large subunit